MTSSRMTLWITRNVNIQKITRQLQASYNRHSIHNANCKLSLANKLLHEIDRFYQKITTAQYTLKHHVGCKQTTRGGSNGWQGGRGEHGPHVRAVPLCTPPFAPPNETVCKVARLHNTCIYSMASHSWCQITPFTQSYIMTSGILAPSKYRSGHPKLLQLETPCIQQ